LTVADLDEDTNPVSGAEVVGKSRGVAGESFYVGRDLAKNVVVEKFINLFDLNDR